MYSFFFLHQFEFPQKLLSIDQMSPTAVLHVYRKLLEVSILSVIFFSSGGHPCTRWIFGKNANSLQTGRSLSSSPHSLSANKPTTDIDTTTESSDEVQTQ